MIETYIVEQTTSYRPVANELQDKLKLIQETWGYKVINVFETTLNERPCGTNQGFIILYERPEVNAIYAADLKEGEVKLIGNPEDENKNNRDTEEGNAKDGL